MTFIVSEDEALKDALKGFYVSDEKNPHREVGVRYANPDVEVATQSYPYITIELVDFTQAKARQMSGIIVDTDAQGTIAPSPRALHTYEIPVPWDLTYQVTTYARHPRHDRAIMAHLLNNVFAATRGYLAVKNDLGTETGYRHLILEEFTKRDTIEDGRRLYRNVFTVTVSSEGTAYHVDTSVAADVVKINVNIADIPAGSDIP